MLVDMLTEARTVVSLGDSITDGKGSTPGHHRRWLDSWPSDSRRTAFLDEAGISGARPLRKRMDVNALARVEQDVLSQPGV